MAGEKKKWRFALAGALAGLINGFFGGGGGMLLVPMLGRTCGLEQKRAFATSVAVILPLCGGLDLMTALPYLIGGAAGGWIGGRTFHAVPALWLRRGFALLLLYGGARNLL